MLSPSQTPYHRSILPGKVGCSEVSSSIRLSYRHRSETKRRETAFRQPKCGRKHRELEWDFHSDGIAMIAAVRQDRTDVDLSASLGPGR